ncbi:hypothetical protein ACFL1X_05980 [Candidatus Hydrogenedentota bacterium]
MKGHRNLNGETLFAFALAAFCSLSCGPVDAKVEEPKKDGEIEKLSKEVAGKGWVLYACKSGKGDYDLFICRPDGSDIRNVTNTHEFSEFGGRFSPDGKRMLYRQAKKGGDLSHYLWGAHGVLVMAGSDGSNPEPQGQEGEYPWAAWGPDGTKISCLYKDEGKIKIFELQTKKLLKEMPSKGVHEQLFWSADGKKFCGTANVAGQQWNIVSIDEETGGAIIVTRALNCTPDWFQASSRIVYSNRTPGLANDYGWTMLMQATSDGKSRALIYGERGKHIYFGCTSPDDKYVIFSYPGSDGGINAPMAVVRLADTPIISPSDYKQLKALYPNAKEGPVLRLSSPSAGFEPHWTYADPWGKDRRKAEK